MVCSHSCRGSDLAPFFDVLRDDLRNCKLNLPIKTIQGSSKWTRFIVHGIPLEYPLADIKTDLNLAYPNLELGADPRWLLPDEKRQSPKQNGAQRSASSVVVTFRGNLTLTSLGVREIVICSRACRLTPYLPFSAGTQCGKCYKLGHPTAMCKDILPTCGVCAEQHASKDHTCSIPGCPGKTRCTHRIKCATCGNPHKAWDIQCPTKVAARSTARKNPEDPIHPENNMSDE